MQKRGKSNGRHICFNKRVGNHINNRHRHLVPLGLVLLDVPNDDGGEEDGLRDGRVFTRYVVGS